MENHVIHLLSTDVWVYCIIDDHKWGAINDMSARVSGDAENGGGGMEEGVSGFRKGQVLMTVQ